jgi:hypothetical protein
MAASTLARILPAAWVLSTGAACSHNSSGAVTPEATTVKVTQVAQKYVPIYREWIGTLDGLVNAELVAALQDRLRLAYIRYRGRVDTQLDALDADRDLFQAELDLAQIRLNELLTVVQLYKALGGGWQ